jgi:hypothetical protein
MGSSHAASKISFDHMVQSSITAKPHVARFDSGFNAKCDPINRNSIPIGSRY